MSIPSYTITHCYCPFAFSSELEKKDIECLASSTDIWKIDSGDVEFRTTEDIIHNNIENTDWNCFRVGKVEEIVGRAEVIRLFEGYSTMDWFEDYVRSTTIDFEIFHLEHISNVATWQASYSLTIKQTLIANCN